MGALDSLEVQISTSQGDFYQLLDLGFPRLNVYETQIRNLVRFSYPAILLCRNVEGQPCPSSKASLQIRNFGRPQPFAL